MKRVHVVRAELSTRLARRQRFAAAREALGEALRASGELAGAPRALPWTDWPRDASGAPAVVRGWHASLADTTGLAVALVAPFPAAVDVEWLHRPRWTVARERFRAAGELARLGADDCTSVLALWTAKEALLKLARVGIADLGRCPLLEREADGEGGEVFRLLHAGRAHAVHVGLSGTHVVACAASEPVAVVLQALAEVA